MSMKHEPITDELFRSILALKDIDECYRYFEDLCTMKEIRDLSYRLEIARILDGGASYQQASEQTGVSSATISRIKRSLCYGTGGYRMMIDRMKEQQDEEQ